MTYVEGASLHQERAGSTVFARYAFNELWSFVAGWALLLDYVILIAITALTATNYFAVFVPALGHGTLEAVVAVALIAGVAVSNVGGLTSARFNRVAVLAVIDLAGAGARDRARPRARLQRRRARRLHRPRHLADVVRRRSSASRSPPRRSSPWSRASGLAGEVAVGRRGLRRLIVARNVSVIIIYVGIAVVALSALPVRDGATALGSPGVVDAPLLGVVGALDPGAWWSDPLRYLVGITGALVLGFAAQSAMLGLSRLAYSLATNRQIPSAVGRLHPTRATPYVAIMHRRRAGHGARAPAGPRLPGRDLRVRGDARLHDRPPVGLRAALPRARSRPPLPHAALGPDRGRRPPAAGGAGRSCCRWPAGSASSSCTRRGTSAWAGWLFGVALYVIYRKSEGKSLLRRVTVPEAALRQEPAGARVRLDPRAAARDAARRRHRPDRRAPGRRPRAPTATTTRAGRRSRPSGSSRCRCRCRSTHALPDDPVQERPPGAGAGQGGGGGVRGRRGRHHHGARPRRRPGHRRRGAPARRRGDRPGRGGAVADPRRGAAGRPPAGPLDNFVGDVTRYVVNKAPCRVILTAPRGRGRARRRSRGGHAGPAADRVESAPCSSSSSGRAASGPPSPRAMLGDGHDVSVLDEDPLSHERLEVGMAAGWEDAGGRFTLGTALEIEALIAAGIEEADVFIASTNGDNTNLVVAQIAQKRFDVAKVDRPRPRPRRGPSGTSARACTRSARRSRRSRCSKRRCSRRERSAPGGTAPCT